MGLINSRNQSISVTSIILLILAIGIDNYFGSHKSVGTMNGLIIFLSLFGALILRSKLHAFVFAFIQSLNLFGEFEFGWAKSVTLLCMFIPFLLEGKKNVEILRDKHLKSVFFLSLLFSIYVILNIALHESFSPKNILLNIGYILGFWVILPAYYYTTYKRIELFASLFIVALTFVLIYYFSLIFNLDMFGLTENQRSADSSISRLMGYDVRQFIMFFFYLIPAFVLSRKLPPLTKVFGIFIGILAYLVLVLAVYRLAMFYVAMGTILSFYFISKYTNISRILKIVAYSFVLVFLTSLFFTTYINNIINVYSWTIDFLNGNADDGSAAERLDHELPILLSYISSNLWIGAGLLKLLADGKQEIYGFVDIPIVGTMAAFGIVGMGLYYTKYYLLLFDSKIRITYKHIFLDSQNETILYVYYTLKAYLITMVTFRLFYISWELTFDYQQIEFGLTAGIYLALRAMLNKNNKLINNILT